MSPARMILGHLLTESELATLRSAGLARGVLPAEALPGPLLTQRRNVRRLTRLKLLEYRLVQLGTFLVEASVLTEQGRAVLDEPSSRARGATP